MTDLNVDPGALRADGRPERAGAEEDASAIVSILEVIHKLKAQIHGKDRIISERTAELRATRDYLEEVFAALAVPVLVIDRAARIESANAAAAELLEYPRASLIGMEARALWVDPDHAAQFAGRRFRALLERGGQQAMAMELRTRDGVRVPVSWTATVLRADNAPRGLVGVVRDVRDERRIEQEKLRTVQALAASVAHEIRNPLGAIINSVGLLRRDTGLEGEDLTLLEIVCEETERIAGIVNQFLDFARPTLPQRVDVDLGGVLREVTTLAAQHEAVLEGKRLLLHVDANLGPLALDPDLVKQVVWNLLNNALDAAQGMVAVRARATGGGGAEVRVADDGPGLAPELIARVAEPFRTTKAQGTGLGLAISRRIVEAHGGVLRFESAPGAGTAVTFTLPRMEAD